ncbi:MAG: GntR family transcriptional regulator [Alphaproteobacteria bacterium]
MATAKNSSSSAQSRAYESIRNDLLAGVYEPDEKLRIEDICRRYEIGTIPVREALSRLAETKLVIAVPQRGYRVATVSAEEYADLVDLRLRLEPEALHRSIERGDIDWEARIAAAYQRLASANKSTASGSVDGMRIWAKEDRNFHAALISNCGSPWTLNFCRVVYEQMARYHRSRIREGIVPGSKTGDEHEQLLQAALNRNADIATDLLRLHIRRVADRIGTALRQGSIDEPH